MLARQRVRRTGVALHQVRGGLPARLRDRERCPSRHRPIHQLLQHPQAALEPSGSNSERGVLRIAASAFGQSSLNPQDPLKELRNLFRSTGPALPSRRGNFAMPVSLSVEHAVECQAYGRADGSSASHGPFDISRSARKEKTLRKAPSARAVSARPRRAPRRSRTRSMRRSSPTGTVSSRQRPAPGARRAVGGGLIGGGH